MEQDKKNPKTKESKLPETKKFSEERLKELRKCKNKLLQLPIIRKGS